MKLSTVLTWRGFVNQTTYKDAGALDGAPVRFYFGVDPSADSMTVGNLAAAMMVRHFIAAGHQAFLLVGGATGMIGDPDGKKDERSLQSLDDISRNKAGITAQYRRLFDGLPFQVVDNYEWFEHINYLDFLRIVGKHVPMRQMLGREFVQSRLGADGSGISYAEFSYALIQGYDFLHLFREHGVTLQLCGADQWGNSLAGVELIRRIDNGEAHVWSTPLVVNKTTGVKFGKSEAGAIWLDAAKTSPTQFYQFWINCDDAGVEDYLKIYTLLDQAEIEAVVQAHRADPRQRLAQRRLATAVTELVHGPELTAVARAVTDILVQPANVVSADETVLADLRREISAVSSAADGSVADALVAAGLAGSKTEARRFIADNAVAINGRKTDREHFAADDFQHGRLLLRRGKALRDSALVELAGN